MRLSRSLRLPDTIFRSKSNRCKPGGMTVLASLPSQLRLHAPGLGLSLGVAAIAMGLSIAFGVPMMLVALLAGMALHFVGGRTAFSPGVGFAAKTLLRIGIALLGFRMSLEAMLSAGWAPTLGVIALVSLTILTGLALARLASRPWAFGMLTSGAVAICGASAALALAAVLPKSAKSEEQTLVTIVGVTALSTLSMLTYPFLFGALGFDGQTIGFLIGATIHDVAQVVGAGYSVDLATGDIAVFTKLQRVALLPLVLLILVLIIRQLEHEDAAPDLRKAPIAFPWFIAAFVAFALLNATGWVPDLVQSSLVDLSRVMLVTAIAALGLKTSLTALGALKSSHALFIVIPSLTLLTGAMIYAWAML